MTGLYGSDGRDSPSHRHESSPSADSGLFVFFLGVPSEASEMSAADDIFLRGKLLPFAAPPPPPTKRIKTHVRNNHHIDHRRADSVEILDRPRGCFAGRLSPEYRKVRRVSESDPAAAPPPRSRPRWYVFLFGSVRVPAAMEMRDIRIRQRRRSPSTIGEKTVEAWRGPWKLLRSLSCRGVESAFATAPLSYV